jgi:hypothetical protein
MYGGRDVAEQLSRGNDWFLQYINWKPA